MENARFRTEILPLKDKFFRLALRITLDRAEAEDITQETLIRMWEQRDGWNEIQSLEAWGLTICRNFALDHIRKRQLQVEREQDFLTPSLHHSVTSSLLSSPPPDEQLDQKQRVAVPAVRQIIIVSEVAGLEAAVGVDPLVFDRFQERFPHSGFAFVRNVQYDHRSSFILRGICCKSNGGIHRRR